MIRGSTPTHYFTSPCDDKNIKKVNVLYGQDDVLLFKKKSTDCTITGNTITTKLTPEESLKFDHSKPGQVQIIIEQVSGERLISLINTFGVDIFLGDGVIE